MATLRQATKAHPLAGGAGLSLLAEIAGRIVSSTDGRPACEILFDQVMPQLGVDICLHYAGNDGDALVLVGHRGMSGVEVATGARGGHPVAAQTVRDRQPTLLIDIQDTDDPLADFERDLGLENYLCVPLVVDDRVIGAVGFGRSSGHRFLKEEVAFLRAATAYLALAKQRLEREAELRASEERLRLAQEFGGIGSFEWDLLTGDGRATQGWSAVTGYGPEVAPTYSNFLKLIFPEDAERFRAGVDETMKAGRSYRSEFRIVRPDDGRLCWIRIDGGIVRDADGRAVRLLGVVRDITDRKLAQEREHLLMRELDHRAKNLLTIIQSVVQLTRADSMDAFVEAVSGRIQALARAHSMLAASRWEGAEMTSLVDEEVAPFLARRERVCVEGPPITLRPAAAQSIALVLHELVTNAAKYGSLSADGGTVNVRWSIRREPTEELFLCWQELGGPPVSPPTRVGFGTAVIHASVARQLGGHVKYDWRREGLYCELVLPARRLVASMGENKAQLPEAVPTPSPSGHLPAKVMIVEDEPLIALQISQLLESLGISVVGPAATISEALELTQTVSFDFALLDVDLQGSRSFPIGDVLDEQGRPYAFLTSFCANDLPERFHGAAVLAKPISKAELEAFFLRSQQSRDRTSRKVGG